MSEAQFVELGGGPGEPEIVLLPPAGGGVLHYLGLAGALRRHGHVTAIRAVGLAAGERPDTSVPAMVERYLRPIMNAPTLPRLLAGWSLGGVLAWEIAARLAEEGALPPAVIMVDSFPAWDDPTDQSRAASARQIVEAMGNGLDPQQRDRLARTARAHAEAASRHRVTRQYLGDVLLVACTRQRASDPAHEWGRLAPRLRIQLVDCSHYEVLVPPQLPLVVDRIEDFLGEIGRLAPPWGVGRL